MAGSIEIRLGHRLAGTQYTCGHFENFAVDAGGAQNVDAAFDIVLHAAKFDPPVIDDDVRTARIAIARLADASGIDHAHIAEIEMVRDVGMSHADDIRLDILQSVSPSLGIVAEVFIERIARRAVHEQDVHSVQSNAIGHRHLSEVMKVLVGEKFPVQGTSDGGECAKTTSSVGGDSLRNGMVVIATNDRRRVSANPIDAGDRLDPVIDEVSCEQAGVKCLFNRLKRRPIRVNVR